ncbi:hypothetical protein ACJIZ3_023773 [Penstemon smallii]|uniref:Uncharacterized protein n=1 Tax=Penstemon smallii TaxID=265156 RepID=A0ABD3TSB5_9LAMI
MGDRATLSVATGPSRSPSPSRNSNSSSSSPSRSRDTVFLQSHAALVLPAATQGRESIAAKLVAKKLSDAPLAIIDKRRQGHNVAEVIFHHMVILSFRNFKALETSLDSFTNTILFV